MSTSRMFQSLMSHSRKAVILTLVLAPVALAPGGWAQATNAEPATAPPVAYASVSELNSILGQVQLMAQNTQADLTKLRIDKWKIDSATKKQTQANVESIQRNLRSALPEMIAKLNSAPEDLAASFTLYRNLDVLYDVFGSIVESAGAFGSKDDFQSLGNDLNALDGARRALGERMQKLAGAKEDELTRLRNQVKTLQAAPPPPPKKIIVDDTEPPKKPVKKKPAKSTPPPANATTPPPTAPPQSK